MYSCLRIQLLNFHFTRASDRVFPVHVHVADLVFLTLCKSKLAQTRDVTLARFPQIWQAKTTTHDAGYRVAEF